MKNINFIRIFIILFLVAFQTQAQKKTMYDSEILGFKGTVRSVVQNSFGVKSTDGAAEKDEQVTEYSDMQLFTALEPYFIIDVYVEQLSTWLIDNSHLKPNYNYRFNNEGNLLFKDAWENGETVFYEYNDEKRLIKSMDKDNEGQITATAFYNYNSDGQLSEIIEYDASDELYGKSYFKYSGSNFTETVFDKNDDLLVTISLEYNAGKKTELNLNNSKESEFQILYNENEQIKLINVKEEYLAKLFPEYNEKNKMSTLNMLIGEERINLSFAYDSNENLIQSILNINDNIMEATYEYEYDKQGNWTMRTSYLNGNPVYISEREIEYD
ncbi:MAG: hypothetical protein PHO74_04145 [Weeksellaceae bacterium]|nr:hypothetical protein [Weeksellaceae bacterium]